jgi:alkylation response protein AidB-like acyl-CoA dehydrogenase
MLVPAEYGGGSISGRGVSDLAIVAEVLGRCVYPGPVLPTNIAAFALARSGSDELAKEHLPSLAAGSKVASWAVAEPTDRWGAEAMSVRAEPSGVGYRLTGVKLPVQDAHVADILIVSADTPDGLTQFVVPSKAMGLTVTLLESLDLARRFCRVQLEGVEVPLSSVLGAAGQAAAAVEDQLALAVTLQCAETVGAADRAYEMTLDYLKDRKSFGRPIGSYQALKHRMADMLLWLESSKAAAVAAVKALEFEDDAAGVASVAKSYIAERTPILLRECLQMHGGVGFTWEHDLHLFMRRVESNAVIYGGVDYHRDRLAPGIGL